MSTSSTQTIQFNFVQCFNQIEGTNTVGFCVGNLLLVVSAWVTMVFCAMLFTFHMNRTGWCTLKTYKDTATYISMFLLFYVIVIVFKYTLTLYNLTNYALIINVENLIYSLLQFVVMSVFV